MLDQNKPVWVLRDSRPYGPFKIEVIGNDQIVARVPNDKRKWVDAEKVPDSRFTSMEIFPISLLTQNIDDANAWRARNEPRPGDLVTIATSIMKQTTTNNKYNRPRWVREAAVQTGVVATCTASRVRLHAQPAHLIDDAGPRRFQIDVGRGMTSGVSKDACIVLHRGEEQPSEKFESNRTVARRVRAAARKAETKARRTAARSTSPIPKAFVVGAGVLLGEEDDFRF